MRIKLLFLLTFLFSLPSFSQQYLPLLDSATNRWTYAENYVLVRLADETSSAFCVYSSYQNVGPTYREYTGSDTVINSLTYKKLYDANSNLCVYGFIREDTAQRKVFFLDVNNSPEIVLYDFSMIPGNTINISFVNNNGYYNSGTYLLDSIRIKNIHHANPAGRKVFYLHCTTNTGQYELQWIEGIGNLGHLVYPYSCNSNTFGWVNWLGCQGDQYNFCQFLTCFEHTHKVYYDSCARYNASINSCINYQDTCDYWDICGDVHELSTLSSFTISPNPASLFSNVKIEMNKADAVDMIIWNLMGEEIFKKISIGKLPEGSSEKNIDVSSLPDGFYLIECRSSQGSLFRKLVVQH